MFINIEQKSYYSLGMSPNSVESIVERNKELGNPAVCLTDFNLFGSVKLEKSCKKHGLKPIHGLTVRIGKDKNPPWLTLIAKNREGFSQLVKINNLANSTQMWDGVPRVDLGALGSVIRGDNLICLKGGPNSELANSMLSDLKFYGARTYEEIQFNPDWTHNLNEYYKIFGDYNVYSEIQLSQDFPVNKFLAKNLRMLELKCVATPNSYYVNKSDAQDQRVLLCNHFQSTLKNINSKYDKEFGLENFFRTSSYHIQGPSLEQGYTQEEINRTLEIGDLCEEYSILNKPILPSLPNSSEILRQRCRDGWIKKIKPFVPKEQYEEYTGRIKSELKVIEDANLSDYFLIITDICDFARKNSILIGCGRGSAAGCMISYLTDITKLDPIRYGLLFERFFNNARKQSMPDIDLDFPPSSRETILEYIREKYGRSNVGQICTFSKMMGRCAVKDVLRIHDALSFDEIQKITDNIPDKAKIADDLQEMQQEDEDEDATIIKWSLLNKADKFKDYCVMDPETHEVSGPLSNLFLQAMRLEGCPKETSKHASGVVVSSKPLTETVPLLHDKSSDELLVGLELGDSESIGLVKLDILGISCLDKFQTFLELLKE